MKTPRAYDARVEPDWESFCFLPGRLTLEMSEQDARARAEPPAILMATLSEMSVGEVNAVPSASWVEVAKQSDALEELARYAAKIGFRYGWNTAMREMGWFDRLGTPVDAQVVEVEVFRELRRSLRVDCDDSRTPPAQALLDWRELYNAIDWEERHQRAILAAREQLPASLAVLFAATGEIHPWGIVRGPTGSEDTKQHRVRGRRALWDRALVGSVPIFGRASGKGARVPIEVIELRDRKKFRDHQGRVLGVNKMFWNDVHFSLVHLRNAFPPIGAVKGRTVAAEKLAEADLRSLCLAHRQRGGPVPVSKRWRQEAVDKYLISGRRAQVVWGNVREDFPEIGSPKRKPKERR